MVAGVVILMQMQETQRRRWESEARLRELQAKQLAIAKVVSERPEFQEGIAKAQAILKGMAGSIRAELEPSIFISTLSAKKKGFWSELFNRVSIASEEDVAAARRFAADQLEDIIVKTTDTYPASSEDIFDLAKNFSYPHADKTAEEYIKSLLPEDYEHFGLKAYENEIEMAFWRIGAENGRYGNFGLAGKIMDSLVKQIGELDDRSAAYARSAFHRYSYEFTKWLSSGGGLLSPEERQKKFQLMREETRRQLESIGWKVKP